MYIAPPSDNHLSRIYPRTIHGQQSLGAVCPACQSDKVKLISHSPEAAFKRQSICTGCGTVWTTRNTSSSIQYKQTFYQ